MQGPRCPSMFGTHICFYKVYLHPLTFPSIVPFWTSKSILIQIQCRFAFIFDPSHRIWCLIWIMSGSLFGHYVILFLFFFFFNQPGNLCMQRISPDIRNDTARILMLFRLHSAQNYAFPSQQYVVAHDDRGTAHSISGQYCWWWFGGVRVLGVSSRVCTLFLFWLTLRKTRKKVRLYNGWI